LRASPDRETGVKVAALAASSLATSEGNHSTGPHRRDISPQLNSPNEPEVAPLQRTAILAALAVLVGSSGATLAQVPSLTTATYGDWTVRCEMHGTVKTCEMEQTSQVRGQTVSQIALGRPAKGAPVRIVLQVPINVWLPTGVTLVTDDKEPGISASFKRCIGNGCIADTDLTDDVVKQLRARSENGKLLFKDAAQRDVSIPVSFKGFADAFDVMAKD
jgi:invasion protein IalB